MLIFDFEISAETLVVIGTSVICGLFILYCLIYGIIKNNTEKEISNELDKDSDEES